MNEVGVTANFNGSRRRSADAHLHLGVNFAFSQVFFFSSLTSTCFLGGHFFLLPLGLPLSLLLAFLPSALVLLEVDGGLLLLVEGDGDLPPPHEPPQE